MLALLLACAVPDDPTALYGLWANVDEDDFVRAWDMAASHEQVAEAGHAYLVYNYALDEDPAVAQVGTFDLLEDHIVTTPSGGAGVSYSNLIVAWGRGWFELEVDKTTGDTRVYEAVDALP